MTKAPSSHSVAKSSHKGWRIFLMLCAIGLVGVGLAWGATLVIPAGGDKNATSPLPITPELIKKGEYLARAGDCTACHTQNQTRPYAGGFAFDTPIGKMYSTNITPDIETGIGSYSYGDFERAVRRGVRKNGDTLYPAMPYPSYAVLSDDDVAALYAYFMKGVPAITQKNKKEGIPWPLSLRWPVTYWRWMFAPTTKPFTPAAGMDPVMARGAYLVEGLGHCGACHTPRAFTLQEKALNNNSNVYLSGESLTMAPSLRGESLTGLGSLTDKDIIDLLKTGRSDSFAIYGGMRDVVYHSMQYMDDADLAAIAHYLKSLAPNRQEPVYKYQPEAHNALANGEVKTPGAQLFIDNCAACHLTTGQGYKQTFPALAGNPSLQGTDSKLVIDVILRGGTMPSTKTAPTQFAMPSFAWRLSDQEVADLVNFIRTSWGNSGNSVTAEEVESARNGIPNDEVNYTVYDPRNPQAKPKL